MADLEINRLERKLNGVKQINIGICPRCGTVVWHTPGDRSMIAAVREAGRAIHRFCAEIEEC